MHAFHAVPQVVASVPQPRVREDPYAPVTAQNVREDPFAPVSAQHSELAAACIATERVVAFQLLQQHAPGQLPLLARAWAAIERTSLTPLDCTLAHLLQLNTAHPRVQEALIQGWDSRSVPARKNALAVLRVMGHHLQRQELQTSALRFSNDVWEHDQAPDKFLDYNAYRFVRGAAAAAESHPLAEGLQIEALRALHNAALPGGEDASFVQAQGGVSVTVTAMSTFLHVSRVQDLGCKVLALLACPAALECGGLHMVLQSMQTHANNAGIQQAGCCAISALLAMPEAKRQALSLGAIETVRMGIRVHRGDEATTVLLERLLERLQ